MPKPEALKTVGRCWITQPHVKCCDQMSSLRHLWGGVYLFLFKFTDAEYKKFLEAYCVEEEKAAASPETLLGDIEAKTRELIGMFCSFLFFTVLRYVFIECVFISSFS